jgi:hypothetical protein
LSTNISKYYLNNPTWFKYGLSNFTGSGEGHISHDLVCSYLERHPEEEKLYLENNARWDAYCSNGFKEELRPIGVYGYYTILFKAEKEISDLHPEYLATKQSRR